MRGTHGETSRDVGLSGLPPPLFPILLWIRTLTWSQAKKKNNTGNPTVVMHMHPSFQAEQRWYRKSEAPSLANSPAPGEARLRLPAGAPNRPSRFLCASPMPSKGSLRLSCGLRWPIAAGYLRRVMQQRQHESRRSARAKHARQVRGQGFGPPHTPVRSYCVRIKSAMSGECSRTLVLSPPGRGLRGMRFATT